MGGCCSAPIRVEKSPSVPAAVEVALWAGPAATSKPAYAVLAYVRSGISRTSPRGGHWHRARVAAGRRHRRHWQGILAGRCGIGPITLFDSAPRRAVCGEVKGFDPLQWMTEGREEVRALHPVRHRRDDNGVGSGLAVDGQRRARGRGDRQRHRRIRGDRTRAPRSCSNADPIASRRSSSCRRWSTSRRVRSPCASAPRDRIPPSPRRARPARTRLAMPSPDPGRLCRRDDLRRRRGEHHAARRRRLCRHARPVHAQRRARAREPSVGYRP